MLGVMILTFALFRIAAGDPAATVLGKNPSPREIEDLRSELGTDKPLFWGKWLRTESFTSVDFSEKRKLPGIKLEGETIYSDDGCLQLKNGKAIFSRNFKSPSPQIKAKVVFSGNLESAEKNAKVEALETVEFIYPGNLEEITLEAKENGAKIKSVTFYREQKSPLNTQLSASIAEIVSFKKEFPYVSFMNFGRALITREPIKKILWRGIWPSLCLMLPIFLGELFIGIILALFSTAFKGSWADKSISLFSIAGMSVSYLVFIIFGQWYLGYYYNLFPVWGWGDLRHLALPVIIGIVCGLGGGIRFYRTVFINELNKEYLRTAMAKGCSEFSIYSRHLLKNAMIPIITRAATVLPFLFTGSLLLETFFGIPGLGYAGINALNAEGPGHPGSLPFCGNKPFNRHSLCVG
jgi:ABC-type dipeptide/oligopeptide/nickel transport system permease component